MTNFNWRTNIRGLQSIESGKKSLAISALYPGVIIPKEGDTITFYSLGSNSKSTYPVKRVSFYNSFGELFQKENYQDILPDATSAAEALHMYKHIFFTGKKNYGIIVCQIASA